MYKGVHAHTHTHTHTHTVKSYGEARLDTIQFLMSLLQMSSQAAVHEWLINQVRFTRKHWHVHTNPNLSQKRSNLNLSHSNPKWPPPPSAPLSPWHTRTHKNRLCLILYTLLHRSIQLSLPFPVFISTASSFSQTDYSAWLQHLAVSHLKLHLLRLSVALTPT